MNKSLWVKVKNTIYRCDSDVFSINKHQESEPIGPGYSWGLDPFTRYQEPKVVYAINNGSKCLITYDTEEKANETINEIFKALANGDNTIELKEEEKEENNE